MRVTAKVLSLFCLTAWAASGLCPTLACAVEATSDQTLPPVDVVTPKEGAAAKPEKPAKAANIDPTAAGAGKAGSGQAIAVLVNDEPVTAYEIEQRRNLALLGSGEIGEYVKKNARPRWEQLLKNPKLTDEFRAYATKRSVRTKEELATAQKAFLQGKQKDMIEQLQREARSSVKKGGRDKAIEELIDERLKLQEAKRLNVLATDEDVEKVITGMAERNKMTAAQFASHMKQRGADVSSMKTRFRVELSWRDVIRRRFGALVAITDRDVDRLVAKAPAGVDDIALEVQRITLTISDTADQAAIAGRMQEAEALRERFTGCKAAAELVKNAANAKLENLGASKPAAIPEPTRSLLLEAKDEDILPPALNGDGVELWIVCGRQAVKADQQQRTAAQEELRQKEFELLAKRHLKDLRQDAHIEYR